MEKLFVSSELSAKLKEKGFDEPCFGAHNLCDELKFSTELCCSANQDMCMKVFGGILAPMYQQVEDWFSKKHNIDFEVDLFFSQHPNHHEGKWHYEGYNVTIWKNKEVLKDLTANTFTDKRKALNFAFEEVLKLI